MNFRLVLFLICISSIKVRAQQDTATAKKTTLTLAALYGSNVSYYGQATSEKLPYVLLNTTLRFPVGVYLSAGSYKLLNYGSGISETDFGAGYDYDFNDKLALDIGYTHSFFPSNSPLLQAANENNINLSANYNWGWVKSVLSTDYAFGKQNDVFISLGHSKEISLGTLFSEENVFTLEPALELIAGTRHFYESYTIEKGKRDQAKGKGKGLGQPANPNAGITTTVAANSFNLLSYNLKLPLTFNRRNYIAEISYQLSVLGEPREAELKPSQSFVGFAFYYQF